MKNLKREVSKLRGFEERDTREKERDCNLSCSQHGQLETPPTIIHYPIKNDK